MAMSKVPFTINYKKHGTLPPIYVAGSFSEPEWQPQEMEHSIDENGEHNFTAQVMVEPEKEYQFKFRAGSTDWWFLDEEHTIGTIDELPSYEDDEELTNVVTDDSGNQNNLLIAPKPSAESQPPLQEPFESVPQEKVHQLQPLQLKSDVDSEDEEDLKTPLFAHESFGAYEFADDDSDIEVVGSENSSPNVPSKTRKPEMTDIDINDPTLEKFPSDRHSILDALRTIQTNLDEDRTHLHDLSPRGTSSRGTSVDSAEDSGHSLNVSSPTSKRRRDSRQSHSSFGRTRSAVSLGSIEEEPRPSAGHQAAAKATILGDTKAEEDYERPATPPAEEPSANEDDGLRLSVKQVMSDSKTANVSLSQEISNESTLSSEADEGERVQMDSANLDTSKSEPHEEALEREPEQELDVENYDVDAGSKELKQEVATPAPGISEPRDAQHEKPKKVNGVSTIFRTLYSILFRNRRNT